jgi:hypothetical protein
MRRRARFFFRVAILLTSVASVESALVVDRIYPINFFDVDGNHLSTAAGRMTFNNATTRERFSATRAATSSPLPISTAQSFPNSALKLKHPIFACSSSVRTGSCCGNGTMCPARGNSRRR